MPSCLEYLSRLCFQRYPHASARAVRVIHMPPPGCSVSRLISCARSDPHHLRYVLNTHCSSIRFCLCMCMRSMWAALHHVLQTDEANGR